MRKPACLAVVGISVVVAAGSIGVTLTRYLGLLAYSPKSAAQEAAPAAGPVVPASPPEEWSNLFAPEDGMKLASRLPGADGKGAPGAARTPFVLVGTIASSTPSARRAILWADGMKEPKAFREKEEVEPGAFLAAVERDKAWIARGNAREKLEILPVGSHARPGGTAPPAAAPPVPSRPPPAAVSSAPAPRPTSDRARARAARHAASAEEDLELLPVKERLRRLREIRR